MAYRRIVVKVGTSTLTDEAGALDRVYIASLAMQCAAEHRAGVDVVLVSSGAIRAGIEQWESYAGKPTPPPSRTTMPFKQAMAAIGQPLLMQAYLAAFVAYDLSVAQVLLTREDFGDRHRFLHARNTLQQLLRLGVIPIINENDTVATEEIRFGDNDTLAAMVASLVDADLLILLSDVDGLFERDAQGRYVQLIREVYQIDERLWQMAGESGSRVGTGGMRTKLQAAQIATTSGVKMVIAHGRQEGVIHQICRGRDFVGTVFHPLPRKLCHRKRWLAYGLPASGAVVVNQGAKERILADGKSLLPAGVVSTEGHFQPHQVVEVRDEQGAVFARGFTNYGSEELTRIAGCKTSEIADRLGFKRADEVIHRDNLVLVYGAWG
ncbi:MAG: glutamate 5-kinase [Armatimonadota bacterium]|nr:glutamate 5-kinase [bacterium]MCS7310792.1 glutamate 5-kinase [Armatimonadota bacterium]MDW8104807.1 glutamate 5-kinase [Armatimonadota bacterium]MDW8290303.1 glutamate 5-kinase [Armatimonadota bacterium]